MMVHQEVVGHSFRQKVIGVLSIVNVSVGHGFLSHIYDVIESFAKKRAANPMSVPVR
jgi:hypothetical protein